MKFEPLRDGYEKASKAISGLYPFAHSYFEMQILLLCAHDANKAFFLSEKTPRSRTLGFIYEGAKPVSIFG